MHDHTLCMQIDRQACSVALKANFSGTYFDTVSWFLTALTLAR